MDRIQNRAARSATRKPLEVGCITNAQEPHGAKLTQGSRKGNPGIAKSNHTIQRWYLKVYARSNTPRVIASRSAEPSAPPTHWYYLRKRMSDTLRYVTWWLQLRDSRRRVQGGPDGQPAEARGECSPRKGGAFSIVYSPKKNSRVFRS